MEMKNSEAIVEDLFRDFKTSGSNFEPDKLLSKRRKKKKESDLETALKEPSTSTDPIVVASDTTASSKAEKKAKKKRRKSVSDDENDSKPKKSAKRSQNSDTADKKREKSAKSRRDSSRSDSESRRQKKSSKSRRNKDRKSDKRRRNDGYSDEDNEGGGSRRKQESKSRTRRRSESPREDRKQAFSLVPLTSSQLADPLSLTERISSPDDELAVGADYASYLDDVRPSADVGAVKLSEHLKDKGHEVPSRLAEVEAKLDSLKEQDRLKEEEKKTSKKDEELRLPQRKSDDEEDEGAFPLAKEKVKTKISKGAPAIGKNTSLLPRNLSLKNVAHLAKNADGKPRSAPISPKRNTDTKPSLDVEDIRRRIEAKLASKDDREYKPPPGPVKGKLLGRSTKSTAGSDEERGGVLDDPSTSYGNRRAASRGPSKIQIGSLISSKTLHRADAKAATGRKHTGEEGEIPISDASLSGSSDNNEDDMMDESDGELQEEQQDATADGRSGRETRSKKQKAKKEKKRKKEKKEKRPSSDTKSSHRRRRSASAGRRSSSSRSSADSRSRSRSPERRHQRSRREDDRGSDFSRRRYDNGGRTQDSRYRYNDTRDYRGHRIFVNPKFIPQWYRGPRGFQRNSSYQNNGGYDRYNPQRRGIFYIPRGNRGYQPRGGNFRGGGGGGMGGAWSWGRGRGTGREHRRNRSYSRSSSSYSRSSSSRSKSPRDKKPAFSAEDVNALRDSDGRIDKKKLFEIARKNASAMLQVGSLQQIKSMGAEELAKLRSGGRSVHELVEYCKRLQKREERRARKEAGETVNSSSSDAESLDEKDKDDFINHPFALKESKPGIILNIPGSVPQAIKTPLQRAQDESTLRLTFPVSSGQQHRSKEVITGQAALEWVPVEKPDPVVEKQKAVKALEPPPPPPVFSPPAVSAQKLLPPPPPPPPMEPPPSTPKVKDGKIFTAPPAAPVKDISSLVSLRLKAVKRMNENPNDLEAIKLMHEAEEQMKLWAESKNLPGQFTGSTGVQCLTREELAPSNYHYESWAKKDQLYHAPKLDSGIGMKLLQKMGWKEGEGLGKFQSGSLEPLTLDVKSDRKGLVATDEQPFGRGGRGRGRGGLPMPGPMGMPPPGGGGGLANLACKHPVSALMELCSKRRWGPPAFTCMESGASNTRRFLWKCVVNGVEYQPAVPCNNKKVGKAESAQVVLQSLGVIPRNQALPMVIG